MTQSLTFSDTFEAWFRTTLARGMKIAHGSTRIALKDGDGAFWPWGYSDVAGWVPADDTFKYENDDVMDSSFVWGFGIITNQEIIKVIIPYGIGPVFMYDVEIKEFTISGQTVRGIDLDESKITLCATINSKCLNKTAVNDDAAATVEMERVRFASMEWGS